MSTPLQILLHPVTLTVLALCASFSAYLMVSAYLRPRIRKHPFDEAMAPMAPMAPGDL